MIIPFDSGLNSTTGSGIGSGGVGAGVGAGVGLDVGVGVGLNVCATGGLSETSSTVIVVGQGAGDDKAGFCVVDVSGVGTDVGVAAGVGNSVVESGVDVVVGAGVGADSIFGVVGAGSGTAGSGVGACVCEGVGTCVDIGSCVSSAIGPSPDCDADSIACVAVRSTAVMKSRFSSLMDRMEFVRVVVTVCRASKVPTPQRTMAAPSAFINKLPSVCGRLPPYLMLRGMAGIRRFSAEVTWRVAVRSRGSF